MEARAATLSSLSQLRQSILNLSWITMQLEEKSLVLFANLPMTGIQTAVQFSRKEKKFSPCSDFEPKDAKQISFSLFFGAFEQRSKKYLLFVDKVDAVPFVKSSFVFKINSLYVFDTESWGHDQELSEILTLTLSKGFFFSYRIDLTRLVNFTTSETPFSKKDPHEIFFINSKCLEEMKVPEMNEWVVPVVFGIFMKSSINFQSLETIGTIYTLVKYSIVDFLFTENLKISEHLPDIKNLISLEMIVCVSETNYQLNFFFSNPPFKGKVMKLTLKKLEAFFAKHSLGSIFFAFKDNEFKSQLEDFELFENATFLDEDFYSLNIFELFSLEFTSMITSEKETPNSVGIFCDGPSQVYEEIAPNLVSLFILIVKSRISGKKSDYINDQNVIEVLRKKLFIEKKEIQTPIELFHTKEGRSRKASIFSRMLNSFSTQDPKIVKLIEYADLLIEVFRPKELDFLEQSFDQSFQLPLSAASQNLTFGLITFNVSGFAPDPEKDIPRLDFVNKYPFDSCDLVVFAFQEIIAMKSKNLVSIVIESREEHFRAWTLIVPKLFPNHVLMYNKGLVGLALMILVKKSLAENSEVSVVQTEILRLGMLNFANKGSILTRVMINQQKFNFLTCHLTSGTSEKALASREEDLLRVHSLLVKDRSSAGSFILGDLNFRCKMSQKEAKEFVTEFDEGRQVSREALDRILEQDELRKLLAKKDYQFFKELTVDFPPTYRFYVNQKAYDLAEGTRIPSWTDRVLISGDSLNIGQDFVYTADFDTTVSDHKPVVLICKLTT